MGFISFNLKYYKEKVAYHESAALTESDIYEAKQLLKMVDDLTDEGYFELYRALQSDGAIVDRLKAVVAAAGETPFPVAAKSKSSGVFGDGKIELTEYVDVLITRAKAHACALTDDGVLSEITRFCDSIGYDKDSAYVFLLRDALLPYIYFKNKHAGNIYPYLISRSFLNLIYEDANVDDIVRAVIFGALEENRNDFESFFDYCKKQIPDELSAYPKIITAIKSLLSRIDSEKIVVVETGCNGTFPMLLSALDERVEFKMYATVPYLFRIYKDKIFTRAYENIRSIETLYCQNSLFRLVDFDGGKFYVSESADRAVIENSLKEISGVLIGYF